MTTLLLCSQLALLHVGHVSDSWQCLALTASDAQPKRVGRRGMRVKTAGAMQGAMIPEQHCGNLSLRHPPKKKKGKPRSVCFLDYPYSLLCFWYSQPPDSSHQTLHCWFPCLFGPSTWNDLPVFCLSLDSFKCNLRTFLLPNYCYSAALFSESDRPEVTLCGWQDIKI